VTQTATKHKPPPAEPDIPPDVLDPAIYRAAYKRIRPKWQKYKEPYGATMALYLRLRGRVRQKAPRALRNPTTAPGEASIAVLAADFVREVLPSGATVEALEVKAAEVTEPAKTELEAPPAADTGAALPPAEVSYAGNPTEPPAKPKKEKKPKPPKPPSGHEPAPLGDRLREVVAPTPPFRQMQRWERRVLAAMLKQDPTADAPELLEVYADETSESNLLTERWMGETSPEKMAHEILTFDPKEYREYKARKKAGE
jgi:hypothetical protein